MLFAPTATPVQPNLSIEWYTPRRYTDAARTVMGSIDLDPASCSEANLYVGATHYYTQEEDGLSQSWAFPHLWLNPPYGKTQGKSNQGIWITRLLTEFAEGRVQEAVILSTASTDRVWFQPLFSLPICFTNHQILFYRPKKSPEHHMHGTCFTYLGPRYKYTLFRDLFSPFGHIYLPS